MRYFNLPNRKNGRVCPSNSSEVSVTMTAKQLAKAMVSGMMGFCGLSYLRKCPRAKF